MALHGNAAADGSLVVFCKRPALGQGKQRLAETIGARQALRVAECLLECTLEDARAWQMHTAGQVVLSPASEHDADWAQEIQRGSLPQPAQIVPQPPGNLGRRLNHVDSELRRAGHRQLIFIGTDAPTLGVDDLLQANTQLDANDVVLQPASDGGVTLMSAARPWPGLEDLAWSSASLQQELCAACLADGCSVWLLPGAEDIDEWADLEQQHSVLSKDQRPARQALAGCIGEIRQAVNAA